MNVFEAIYERRSIRSFDRERHIDPALIERIISSISYALPAPDLSIPWKLLVVRDENVKNILGDCAKEVAMTMFGASFEVFGPGHLWYLPEDVRLRVAENTVTGELWEYPKDSDVVFVPCICRHSWTDNIHPFTTSNEVLAQFLGFPTQNMWLVGHKYGVGAGYNGMPLLDIRRREIVMETLGIPPSWEPTGAFSFGYAKEPRYFGPTRPSIEGVTFSEYWGNPYIRMGVMGQEYTLGTLPQVDVEDTIKNLRFVSNFQSREVPQWMVEQVVDPAIWGPVPENFKNWRFMIVKDEGGKRFIRDLAAEGRHSPFFFNWPEIQYARYNNLEKVEEVFETGTNLPPADTYIVITTCYDQWRDQPYIASAAGRMPMLAISTGCCIQNMIIAASALGLGVNYSTMPFASTVTRDLFLEHFGIPGSGWIPLGVLAIGFPGNSQEFPAPDLSSLVFNEYWGNPYSFQHRARHL